jgi:hypothetical protein
VEGKIEIFSYQIFSVTLSKNYNLEAFSIFLCDFQMMVQFRINQRLSNIFYFYNITLVDFCALIHKRCTSQIMVLSGYHSFAEGTRVQYLDDNYTCNLVRICTPRKGKDVWKELEE